MKNSRTQNATYNLFTSISIKILTLILQFLSRIVFVRVLAASYLGINGLFTNILSLLSLADLGMQTAMTYSLYKPLAEQDEKKIAQLVCFFKKIYTVIAIGVFLIGIILIPFVKFIVNLDEPLPYLEIYYLLFLMNTVFSYLYVYKTTLMMADQREYVFGKVRVVYQVTNFILVNLCLYIFQNYMAYLLIGNICRLIQNIIENRVVTKNYPYIDEEIEALPSNEKQDVYSNVKSLFLYKLCAIIQNNTDSILISVLIGTVIVGYYSNYLLIINGVVVLITTVFSAFKAGIGNLLASENTVSHKYTLFKSLDLLSFWMTAICSIILLVIFNDAIMLIFGKEYVLNLEIVIVIILNFYTSNVRQAIWAYRETTGIFSQTKYITLVTAVINLVLSIVLGNMVGLFGIILATVIARMVYAWWKEPQILFRQYFKMSPDVYYKQYILNMGILLSSGGLAYYCCEMLVVNSIFVSLIVKIVLCVFIFNLIFIAVYWKNREFQFILDKFKQVFKRC